MEVKYFIETKDKFETEKEAREFAKSIEKNHKYIRLHIHKHGKDKNEPCEIVVLKDELKEKEL